MSESESEKLLTGFEAGLSGDEQIRICLGVLAQAEAPVKMAELYDAVETHMPDSRLSKQGRSSLRFFVNKVAVRAGVIYPHDKSNPGWRITPEGRAWVADGVATEEVVDADSGATVQQPNSVRGLAFELWMLGLLKAIYPFYTWFHQGALKQSERGLDFIGTRLGVRPNVDEPGKIGVQVKFHGSTRTPSQVEWLKFLSGSLARRLDLTIFVTTGRLTGHQRREADEANVVVIEGRAEVKRIAKLYDVKAFDLFEKEASP